MPVRGSGSHPSHEPAVNRPSHNLEQISSKRLLPTRHQTKNAILSISDTKEVCIEFIKRRGTPKRDVVFEVCRISPDGLRIIIYQPENGKGLPPSSSPPPLPSAGTDQIFSFENLPEKHWKKYAYAAKFVELVKAKTPKITYYTDKAKCLLMENLTDFEACFHEGKGEEVFHFFNLKHMQWLFYLMCCFKQTSRYIVCLSLHSRIRNQPKR